MKCVVVFNEMCLYRGIRLFFIFKFLFVENLKDCIHWQKDINHSNTDAYNGLRRGMLAYLWIENELSYSPQKKTNIKQLHGVYI